MALCEPAIMSLLELPKNLEAIIECSTFTTYSSGFNVKNFCSLNNSKKLHNMKNQIKVVSYVNINILYGPGGFRDNNRYLTT